MICAYKATITKSKVFFREYHLESDMTLYHLHEFLCGDLEYSLDQMVYFEALDKKGNPVKRYGLFDFGDGSMDTVTLQSTIDNQELVLRYVYNVPMNLSFILTFVSEQEFNRKLSYPCLVNEKGRIPDQFSAQYEDFEEYSDYGRSSFVGSDDDQEYDDDELPEGEEGE
jgi:hypothetical protein